MSLRIRVMTIAFFATFAICAQDQNSVGFQLQELDEVVVSDSRFELNRENSGKTVIKIDSLELLRNQGRSVAEIINIKSGLEITGSRSRQGEVLGVFARGGRGRQVLVIIDGVRVTDPSSFSQEYDLRLLSGAQIASIEIIKGAASTLYGTNAATAVINIKTKSPSSSKIGGEVQSSVGTNQSSSDQNFNPAEFTNSASLGGTLNKFTYSVAFAHTYVDGLSSIETDENEEDRTKRYSTNIQLGYKFNEDLNLRVYANQTKLDTEYDESFGLIDAPYSFISDQRRIGLAGNWEFKDGELVLNTAFSEYESENISAFPGTFKGQNYVADLYGKYVFKKSFYTVLGLNVINDQAEFADIESFTIVDPYANVVYVSDFGLNINAGMRLNNHSEYGSEFVYNLNPSYVFQISQGYFKLLSSYATSFVTPSLTQLFGEFGANPELEPESNRTSEAGIEYHRNNKLRTSLVYFDRKEENFVFFDNIDFQYVNADGTIDVQGVEVEADWTPLPVLGISANYTYTDRQGDNAIRIPRHKANANVGYDLSKKALISVNYAYTGKRTDTDFNTFTDVELDPFSVFGLSFHYQIIQNKLRAFLNVDNIFNSAFTEVIGFTTRGRNMRVGISLNL